jgi:FRG domain-containing protein
MDREAWAATEHYWLEFLEAVRLARAEVRTTYAGAWFRGQVHHWDLSPSILRYLTKLDQRVAKLRNDISICEYELQKARAFLKKKGVIGDDQLVARFVNEIGSLRTEVRRLEQAKSQDNRIPGEGRAFIEFRFRSGSHHQSSWQTLAEMQHYGVPTRLLDWTESFIHALAFALQNYAAELALKWKEDRYSETPPQQLRWHNVTVKRQLPDETFVEEIPTIWILNPYRLAERSKGKNVLWDLTLDPRDDYYSLFVGDNSDLSRRFDLPIPVLSPWEDQRVAAQRGVFTCHGNDLRSLNEQVSDKVARAVHLPREAAIHGVRFLSEVGALDRFAMFRDRDSLGKKTRDEFLSRDLHN